MTWKVIPKPFGIWDNGDGTYRLHGHALPDIPKTPMSLEQAEAGLNLLKIAYEAGQRAKAIEIREALGIHYG